MSECRLVLFDQSKKANIGTIVRSAVAMGVKQIVVSGAINRSKVNTHGAKGARCDVVEIASVEDACSSLKQQGFQVVGVEIGGNSVPLNDFKFAAKTALIMGNEGSGMSARALACCDALVYIRQFSGGTASLNVACAATVVLREVALQLQFPESGVQGAKFVEDPSQEEHLVAHLLVGSYTQPMGHVPHAQGKGISWFQLDLRSGQLSLQSVTEGLLGPSFLAYDASSAICYAAEESGGSVAALSVLRQEKQLRLERRVSSGGADPCCVAVRRGSGVVAVTNYSGSSVALLDMQQGVQVQVIQENTPSRTTERQQEAHPHFCTFIGESLFYTDLGADKVRFAGGFAINTRPGSGPRHLVVNPRRPLCYVLCELDCSVCVYSMLTGQELQRLETLPPGVDGKGAAGDVHLSEDGRFLYCSNRGDDSLSLFGVKPSGLLGPLKGHYSCRGRCPRAFALVDKYLLCCNQDSNDIAVFRVWLDGSLEFVLLQECGTPVTIQQIND